MIQTAIWIPPSLCGCQLKITGDFSDVTDGISHRHPTPFTITDIEIINVCDLHKNVAGKGMPDTAHLFETDSITGNKVQRRGYLQLPLDTHTDAQILYHYLCGHKGQNHSYPCGCTAYQWGDFSGNYTYVIKDGVTKKCLKHADDTIDMKSAKADFDSAISS